MRLKSLTLKGFKSFPDRTVLEFGPGVSVVVGPNGSGKSNVTDAMLWAMGEQSPLAVRGQTMQDVIFGGGRGVSARAAAEVELVLDNADGTIDLPLSEIAITRRLERSGEGGYTLNGARCRLVDVLEVLSDTGLGKETHSVVSQGRVESIVTSKPRDRRLLIEEAAGLGKHRKRRRRAQLKLERTRENLERVLDVEREARLGLRPLKRQAEAAELHERLERQTLEARWTLALESLRVGNRELEGAEAQVAGARAQRETLDSRLRALAARRAAAERALTERSSRRDELARRAYETRSARDRVELRHEQVDASAQLLGRRIELTRAQLDELSQTPPAQAGAQAGERARGSGPESATVDRQAGEELWGGSWERVRSAIAGGVQRALERPESERARVLEEALEEAELLAREALERALASALSSGQAEEARRRAEDAANALRERAARLAQLRARLGDDLWLEVRAERLAGALERLRAAIAAAVLDDLERALSSDDSSGETAAEELRACAAQEAELQGELRAAGEAVTVAEVAAQRLRDQTREAATQVQEIAARLGLEADARESVPAEPLAPEEAEALRARVQRLDRRREQIGPVNPLAQDQYAQALEHVQELETRREDLQTALRELGAVIRDTDRLITETFEQTFATAAENFQALAADLFPGGSGRLRLVPERGSGEDAGPGAQAPAADEGDAEVAAEAEAEEELREDEGSSPAAAMGVEIEIAPAGRSRSRLSLLSGGEKSMTALAFLFAVFLARPCPFYILDEVEAALDDLNLDRFVELLRRYSDRAQFIVITHQKRTMEAADWLFGVSMGADGVSKVISRRLPAPAGDASAPSQSGRERIASSPAAAGLSADPPADALAELA